MWKHENHKKKRVKIENIEKSKIMLIRKIKSWENVEISVLWRSHKFLLNQFGDFLFQTDNYKEDYAKNRFFVFLTLFWIEGCPGPLKSKKIEKRLETRCRSSKTGKMFEIQFFNEIGDFCSINSVTFFTKIINYKEDVFFWVLGTNKLILDI